MRIIFASSLVILTVALLATAAFASDQFYEPERIKRFETFYKCVSALKKQHAKDIPLSAESVTETEQTRTNTRVTVSAIEFSAKRRAAFTVSGITTMTAKPGSGLDGGTFGWGTDWYCDGTTLWRGGGHSAYVPIPTAPEPPKPQPAREAP